MASEAARSLFQDKQIILNLPLDITGGAQGCLQVAAGMLQIIPIQ